MKSGLLRPPPRPRLWARPGAIPCVACGQAWATRKPPGQEGLALFTHCDECAAGLEPGAPPPPAARAGAEALPRSRSADLAAGLIAALECRDAETHWHSRRVSLFARHLGLRLGLAGQELALLELGALLHDLGKLAVRDAVLHKDGPLTAREREEMRRHPDLGWGLLQKLEVGPAAEVVLQHHERWDGQGYPRGLRGARISLPARVFAVVDAMDAMTFERPYHPARPMDSVRREVAACAGSQFDPAVTDCFLRVPDEDWAGLRQGVGGARLARP